jgi:hypothetical protein
VTHGRRASSSTRASEWRAYASGGCSGSCKSFVANRDSYVSDVRE